MADERHDTAAQNPDAANASAPVTVVWCESEVDNAQEWGAGLGHSKAIARGGKSEGFVEGATEQQT
jgi:hypothetical protein